MSECTDSERAFLDALAHLMRLDSFSGADLADAVMTFFGDHPSYGIMLLDEMILDAEED